MEVQYTHLEAYEREQIESGLAQGLTHRRIAALLNRSQSSISREIRRGHWKNLNRYSSVHGELHYKSGRKRAGRLRRKLPVDDMTSPLWQFCLHYLGQRLSPEQVSGLMRHTSPSPLTVAGAAVYVCPQSIYAALDSMPHGALRAELTRNLRHSRGGRRKRRRGNQRFSPIQNFTSIHERPAEVALKRVPGHLEGDLMVGAYGQSFLGVIVERISQRLWLVKLDSANPTHVRERFFQRLRAMPKNLRLSMTYDRGWEMAEHSLLTQSLDMPIYFCDPYSPWQRGLVENTNGLLRQYFPRGTDFNQISQQRLDEVERELNDRPRKTHRFKSPAQMYQQFRLNSPC